MANEQCPHRTGYEKALETERFVVIVMRCAACGEYIRAATKEKKK